MDNYQSTALSIAQTKQQLHPQASYILEKSTAIAKELGIYDGVLYEGHHTMAPYLFVNADAERVIDATVWFGSLYYFDDFFGEDTAHAVKADFDILFKAWMTGKYEPITDYQSLNNLYGAIAYASHRIQTQSPKAYFKRYTEGLTQHLQHSLKPTDYTTIEEYIASRVHFGGMYPTIGMIEFTHDSFINPLFFELIPGLRAAKDACALIGALSNDIISYHKECHSKFNLLNAYLETGEAKNLDESIKKSIQLVNQIHEDFKASYETALKTIKKFEHKDARIYLDGLERLVAASYHWQVSTNRYRSSDNVFSDLKYPIEERMPLAF